MSFPRDAYPYTNFHELNLGYFIVHFREIFSQWADLYDQMLNWKNATDEELATWKAGVEADLDQREAALRAELETWKAQTGQDIAGWEDATLAALTAWQTATQAVFEAIRVEAAGSASAAAASAGDAATAKTAAETAQAAAEAAAASVQASAAQITTNTEDIADLKTQLNDITTGTYNLVAGKIENALIDSDGKIANNITHDVFFAPVVFGNSYTVKTDDTSNLVCAFYSSEPEKGSVSYNNSRTLQASKTIEAPISGYIVFRTEKDYTQAQVVEGTEDKPYLPPFSAKDIKAREDINNIETEIGNIENAINDINDNIDQHEEEITNNEQKINDISESTYNLVIGVIENALIDSAGKITRFANQHDVFYAPVTQGDNYTVKTDDTSGLVCAFYTDIPELGDSSYNTSRTIQANMTIQAPITGYIAFRTERNYTQAQVVEGTEDKPYLPPLTAKDLKAREDISNIEAEIETKVSSPLCGMRISFCGDSITQGSLLDTLPENDKFRPLTGLAKPTFGYYIAKCNNAKWDNKGISGSTLSNIQPGGVNKNSFITPSTGRLYNLPDDMDYIVLQFGNNDGYYGPISQREKWLYDTYGETIYWPSNPSQIGSSGYATQEQVDACNAVTGEYQTSDEYFQHQFLGNATSSDDTLYNGAWNIALEYIISNYPYAKILIMSAYNELDWVADADKEMALRWGVAYLRLFADNQMLIYKQETATTGEINGVNVAQYRINNLTLDGTHQNLRGMQYMWQRINAELCRL